MLKEVTRLRYQEVVGWRRDYILSLTVEIVLECESWMVVRLRSQYRDITYWVTSSRHLFPEDGIACWSGEGEGLTENDQSMLTKEE